MPKVYVTQDSRVFALNDAAKFGELKVALPAGDANFSIREDTKKLRETFASFNNKEDYILLTGNPTMIMVAGFILYELVRQGESFRVLKWDKKSSSYMVQEVFADDASY